MRSALSVIFLFLSFSDLLSQDIIGQWKTIDDETGRVKSIVEIFKEDDLYYGKIIKLIEEDQNALCNECDDSDDRYQQPIVGLEIIRDLKKENDEYVEGTVLDPENGTVYRCKVWLEGDDLMLRGYVAFFFRTQRWIRYK